MKEEEKYNLKGVSSPVNTTVQEVKQGVPDEVVKEMPTTPQESTPEKNWDEMRYNMPPSAYMHERAKYYIDKGESIPYSEMVDIFSNGKRSPKEQGDLEKKEKNARILLGVGNVLGNLINYNRARNGHVAMDISSKFDAISDRMKDVEQRRKILDRQDYQDYMSAYMREKAEKEAKRAREYQEALRNQELGLKLRADQRAESVSKSQVDYNKARTANTIKEGGYIDDKQNIDKRVKESQIERNRKAGNADMIRATKSRAASKTDLITLGGQTFDLKTTLGLSNALLKVDPDIIKKYSRMGQMDEEAKKTAIAEQKAREDNAMQTAGRNSIQQSPVKPTQKNNVLEKDEIKWKK